MHTRTRLIAVLAVLSGLALLLVTELGALQAQQTRVIPLNTVYATFNQEGLKSADEAADNEGLVQAVSAIREMPEQIVLCVGSDVSAAMKSSAVGFSVTKDQAPIVAGSTSETLWVAAYLGTDGSIPAAYRIRAIELKGKILRVAYERDESPTRSCDLLAYMIWAPVGQVEAGAYTLELFDATAGTVTVTRTWQVAVR